MFGRRRLLGRDHARRWSGRHPRRGPDRARPQVLFETPDPGEAFACWRLLGRSGYEMSWCPGPGGSPSGTCALVASGDCALAERAGVIVSSLGLHHESSRQVLGAIRRRFPETPVIVTTTAAGSRQWASLLTGIRTLFLPVTRRTLLASVEAATGRSRWAQPRWPTEGSLGR